MLCESLFGLLRREPLYLLVPHKLYTQTVHETVLQSVCAAERFHYAGLLTPLERKINE